MSVRVVVADDQPLVRAGIAMLLAAEEGIDVTGEAGDGQAAIDLIESTQADLVLMDLRMPGLDGIEATRRLTADDPTHPDRLVKVLVLTTLAEDDSVYGALRAGAHGFMLKHAAPASLAEAVRRVAGGEAWIDPAVAPTVLAAMREFAVPSANPQPPLAMLTPREREVLALVAEGLSNAEISTRLVVSEATVKTHVARILMKTGSRDRAQAVVLAFRSGLVTP